MAVFERNSHCGLFLYGATLLLSPDDGIKAWSDVLVLLPVVGDRYIREPENLQEPAYGVRREPPPRVVHLVVVLHAALLVSLGHATAVRYEVEAVVCGRSRATTSFITIGCFLSI